MWLQLDPSVMAALPLSLRRELEREYKRQQVKKPSKQPVPKFKSEKEPEVLKDPVSEPRMQRGDGLPTSLEDLWFGSPPKWLKLFKNYKGPGESKDDTNGTWPNEMFSVVSALLLLAVHLWLYTFFYFQI